MHDIYLDNGIVPRITIKDKMLQFINSNDRTDGFLEQEQIINDDCLLLRYDEFERILIFSRNRIQTENKNKANLLSILRITLKLVAFNDKSKFGITAPIKEVKRPGYVYLDQIDKSNSEESAEYHEFSDWTL